ncbi:hypothetical protein QCA50_004239 [Cerrena zonata]|uniref:Uncharacterized protein n=1 Tax=Cerrena zonata TaxID=2478898 RepID=A0AAW0GRK3_9APHY
MKDSKELPLPTSVAHDTPESRRRQRRLRHFCTATFVALALCLVFRPRFPGSLFLDNDVEVTVTNEYTRNPAYLIKAKHGAVASENEICSNIGVNTLKAGGNAVDAAVSTTLCIGVTNMFSSGIGGGGFMVIRIPPSITNGSSEVYSIDFRETAPALANKTMYVQDPRSSMFGGLAVGVPGELRGLGGSPQTMG